MYDFIAIGDTITDDFIELDDVRIDTRQDPEDKGYPEICFRFGDKVPFKSSVVIPAVGNAANAATSATRLGLKTAFITDIGDDEYGKKKVEALGKNGIDTRFVKIHPGLKSHYHYVLRYKAERTILVNNIQYPYALPSDLACPVDENGRPGEAPKWIYFSSVSNNNEGYHHEIARYLASHPETKFAFQPGTYQMKLGTEKIKDLYEETDIFFCNKEEARIITNSSSNQMKELLVLLHGLGPKIAVITDGPNGAYTYDGKETWFIPMYPDPKPPVDRTGSGDAFSSTFTAAIALGKSLPEALSWGPVNSMSVVQYIGAQEGLLSREMLETYLKNAPEEYKPQQV